MLFTFEEYYSLKLKDSEVTGAEIENMIGEKFVSQDPEIVRKFQDVFLAAYQSRNLKSLDACRKESFIYKTRYGENNGVTMIYKIGITNSQDDNESKEFDMNIGMKFEIWKIDDKVEIIALADMYD